MGLAIHVAGSLLTMWMQKSIMLSKRIGPWCAAWLAPTDSSGQRWAALERIHDLADDYVNFLHPVRRLVSKTRCGPRATRRYDIATTPFHRLLDSGVLSI